MAEALTEPVEPRLHAPRWGWLTLYELAVVVPLVAWIIPNVLHMRDHFDPMLLLWVVAIAAVDLLPVPTSTGLNFSLSFPLQLAVAVIYSPPVAAAVAMVGTSDMRELKRELPLLKALFIRAQIALSVVVESVLFHLLATFDSPWYQVGGAILAVTAVGYSVNALMVAVYLRIDSGRPLRGILRQMHVGIFGEFLMSYMGLALFGVMIAAFFVKEGVWSILVFVAPMAFARQMFARTHSLQVATEELAERTRENEYQALHDALTGLPNRTLFLARLKDAIDQATNSGEGFAVVIMDLDQFKEINDTLGHHYGDVLLTEVAERIKGVLREEDTIARLGGDEFGVLVPGARTDDLAPQLAQRLLAGLHQPLVLEGIAIDVSASMGIAVYPQDGEDVDVLLRNADVAMYAAKEAHTGFELYAPDRDQYSPSRLALLGQVRGAIERGEFVLFYQPKQDLATGRVRGVEALIRWQHPDRGLIDPDEFIPLVERTIVLRPLTLHVLNKALRQCRAWRQAGLDLGVAVNVSPRSLLDRELPGQVANLLKQWGVPAFYLRLEITETSLMADSVRSMEVLAGLSAVGVGLSIDDFGTGYSSLEYLGRLPVDEIKIDKSFVIDMCNDSNDATIVRATIDLSHNLGFRVVAEGVETEETLDRLTELRCDVAQGYFLSRPMPAHWVVPWLREHSAPVPTPSLPHRPHAPVPARRGRPSTMAVPGA